MILAKNDRNGKTSDPAIAYLLCNRLLERWAELEPSSHKADSAKRWRLVKAPAMRSMIIQSLVQDAIAAHNWQLCLEFDRQLWKHGSWSAVISLDEHDKRAFDQIADEPAIALLSAYVQALEAFAKIGGVA